MFCEQEKESSLVSWKVLLEEERKHLLRTERALALEGGGVLLSELLVDLGALGGLVAVCLGLYSVLVCCGMVKVLPCVGERTGRVASFSICWAWRDFSSPSFSRFSSRSSLLAMERSSSGRVLVNVSK